MTDHAFTAQERRAVYRVIAERRDMRRFVPGSVVDEDVLARVLQAAHAAPSVGLMQPWRFIRVTDDDLRKQIHELVEQERLRTAQALGERSQEFLALMLGTRRTTVTLVAGELQRQGLIHYTRGKLTVLSREKLEAAACDCYRITKVALERLYK